MSSTYASKVWFARQPTPPQRQLLEKILRDANYQWTEDIEGFFVQRDGQPVRLSPEISDQVACLNFVLGVFDTPVAPIA